MAHVLYKKQSQILDFIRQYIQRTGAAPRLRDIANAAGVRSLATVHEHVQTLIAKGYLTKTRGKLRSISLVTNEPKQSFESVDVPILGYIAAGQPLEPYTDPNATMSIPPTFASSKKRVYVLKVKGESMIEEQIRDGDFVVIEQVDDVNNGDIVVALLDNGMATLKRYFKEATRIRLEPANSTMSPIFARNVRIQGKVVGLIRRYQPN